ncbi:MAG: helix-turn-helix transcriptional regulator [Defluviitaleaceae bacterium]|nr:helix-turn-helix transcriptional regulator [Defluviitaleaceae bacterium]
MKIAGGEVIRRLRKELGINQEEMSERLFLSERQLSRIETGETKMDVWQLMSFLETLGHPSEDFWLLYLDSDDYEGYRTFRKLRSHLRNDDKSEAQKSLDVLMMSSVADKPLVRQIITWAEIRLNDNLSDNKVIEELYKVLKISRPNFDVNMISELRLNYTEIRILMSIAAYYSKIGNREKAIHISDELIKSRENSQTSEEDRAIFFPALFFGLSNLLGQAGRIKDSLKACEKGLEISKEYNNFRFVPQLLHNKASGLRLQGEEEKIYKPLMVRAYHCAYAMGLTGVAKRIKEDAKNDFGILEL